MAYNFDVTDTMVDGLSFFWDESTINHCVGHVKLICRYTHYIMMVGKHPHSWDIECWICIHIFWISKHILIHFTQHQTTPIAKTAHAMWQWVQTRIPFVFNIKIIGIYGSSCHFIYLQKIWKKHIVVPILPRMCHGQKHCVYIYIYICVVI